ncbi:MAG: multicopper oxidase domain-containing protein [Sulfuricella sp.]|nr:multicopper oxidase domain-containing protein [Sulfuricella sp.]
MISRRDFLKTGAMATTGILVPLGLSARTLPPGVVPAFPAASPVLSKFTNQLFVPPTTTPDASGVVNLSMENNIWNFHDDTAQLSPTPTFGYMVNGIRAPYLGATIIAQRGKPVTLNATNNLGVHPMAPWISTSNGVPGIQAGDATAPRAAVHHHGGYNLEGADGGPFDWFPGNTNNPLLANKTYTYNYANDMQAATQWYHDHAVGITRLNVYAGLAGCYWLRDQYDTGLAGNSLGLPYNVLNGSTYEIPLVLQDKAFVNAAPYSSLNYTANAPTWLPEFFGDVSVVNGKAWPNLNVEQAVYRFRLINGAEARLFNLSLSNGGLIYQIGTEAGLLNAPVRMSALLLAPGERADILLDFTKVALGSKIILQNNAPAPFPSGGGGVAIPQLMQFTVSSAASGAAVTVIPATLRSNTDPTKPAMLLPAKKAALATVQQVNVLLYEVMGPGGPALDTVNLLRLDEALQSVNAVKMTRNTLVQWNIINMTGDVHPLHTHLFNFLISNRQNFNTVTYQATLDVLPFRNISATNQSISVPNMLTGVIPDPATFVTGSAYPPAPNEAGWKDTVMCPPGQVTRILAPIGYVPSLDSATPAGTVSGVPYGQNIYNKSGIYGTQYPGGAFTGSFVYHCHILDHEENDMMQMFQVNP